MMNNKYLLILTSVGKPLLTRLCRGNDTRSLDKRIGQSGLSMVDMGNNTVVSGHGCWWSTSYSGYY